jgi:hypothetical protein
MDSLARQAKPPDPRGLDSARAGSLGLGGVPARTNQNQRDAIAAAMTARQHSLDLTETIGGIVVPIGRW